MCVRHACESRKGFRARDSDCGCEGWRTRGNGSVDVGDSLVLRWVLPRNVSGPKLDDRRATPFVGSETDHEDGPRECIILPISQCKRHYAMAIDNMYTDISSWSETFTHLESELERIMPDSACTADATLS